MENHGEQEVENPVKVLVKSPRGGPSRKPSRQPGFSPVETKLPNDRKEEVRVLKWRLKNDTPRESGTSSGSPVVGTTGFGPTERNIR